MAGTMHPWTMYEVARYRDEERLLRAQAARLAHRARPQSKPEAQSSPESTSRFARMRLGSRLSGWAQAHHLLPHHARQVSAS